ncbi:septal ring lytic transglycosylase RlpA family protein [Formosa sp. PL04]|uniref:septal ring lytic transglycosylase RlpA family protein n=1 Tax=Formosa sp. PL04 TaxID=3081755 RepID=UPI002981105D|nr:septal ring lytic transglycosylase RlpA family protein [Formosa sp. PL04]MDW5289612.1 septal ring lytic transglycosylase RlpA family protein [Formosa sp. PL04]
MACFLLGSQISMAQSTSTGNASFYSNSLQGKKTASGEPYKKNKLTAAHRTLPFNTKVKVTNLSNNKSVIVIINDRGPHKKSRIIDVSEAAAKKIDLIDQGIAQVEIEVLED